MENLNKENFWNDLHKKFPQAVDLFYTWIDDYKKEVRWDSLFFNGEFMVQSKPDDGPEPEIRQIKFHDLPFEMQNGIIARFDIECLHGVLTGRGRAVYEVNRPMYMQNFVNLFSDLQKQLDKQNN